MLIIEHADCTGVRGERPRCEDGRHVGDRHPDPAGRRRRTGRAWYQRLGFTKQWEHRFTPDLPAFVEVARGQVKLFLSEHQGDARPDTLIYLVVENLDEVAAEFGVPAEDMPWGRREVILRDPDGNRLRVAAPLAPKS